MGRSGKRVLQAGGQQESRVFQVGSWSRRREASGPEAASREADKGTTMGRQPVASEATVRHQTILNVTESPQR